MANFDMCKQKRCSLAQDCRRQTDKKSEFGQVYGIFAQNSAGQCMGFKENGEFESVRDTTANRFTKS